MIKIFSDPHIGLNRTSHTTPASRAALKQALYEQASMIVHLETDGGCYCLGDLFESYWSDAETLQQGLEILGKVDLCLIGNHDVSNRATASSAMRFISNLDGSVWDKENEASVQKMPGIQFINHKMTQGLFDASLEMVEAVGGLLFLHCNYNSGFSTNDASLNLTHEQAEKLLEKVDKIFIGHEHIPASYFGGRLIITGNTHPTSFSDISDKYVYYVDADNNVTKDLVWEAAAHSIKVPYSELAELNTDDLEFIEITGEVEKSELPAVARAVANLWKSAPNAFMIKNSTSYDKSVEKTAETSVCITNPIDAITKELENTSLFQTWVKYKMRTTSHF